MNTEGHGTEGHGGVVGGGAVLGGGSMDTTAYADFLGAEYLATYVASGGGSVKVAVAGEAAVAARLAGAMASVATERDCLVVTINAETTRVHLIDQVFFAVSRQVDWAHVAAALVRQAYDEIAVPASGSRLTVDEVAADHDLDARELYRSVRRQLERSLLDDATLPRELRRALLRLAQGHLGGSNVSAEESRVVLDWLRGERVGLRDLRDAMIYTRIGRHNARLLLESVGRLLLRSGAGGLVLLMDLSRLAESRRPPLAERDGFYYSKAAVLDTYELLRQLVDSTDTLAGTLIVATVPPELVADEARGLPAYAALHLRVADEVRDRRRPNPFAALVRLDVRLEAVR